MSYITAHPATAFLITFNPLFCASDILEISVKFTASLISGKQYPPKNSIVFYDIQHVYFPSACVHAKPAPSL